MESFLDVYEAAESLGSWPSQIELITMPALPKPAGGYRLIGIFAGAYRVWAKARRPWADDWERRHERKYFASGSGRSPIDAVWRQAWRAEAAQHETGMVAAAVLADLEKFYEHMDHDVLIERARSHGFPEVLVRMAVAAYGGPRMIRLRDFVATEVYADRGVVAGCPLATTLVKVYTLSAYDELLVRAPSVWFDNYIDDNVLSAQGPPSSVVHDLVDAANILHELMTEDLGCRIARGKTRVVASSDEVGRRISRAISGCVGGEMATAAPNLGVDFAAGRRRAAHGRSNTRAQRLRKGFRRRKRLKRLAAVVGGRALGIFTTGTLSGMIYGSEINGISDVELLKINRLAAVTMRPSARGRSLSMLMALHKSPTWRAGTAPVLQYVRAAWRAMAVAGDKDGADLTFPELRQALESLDVGRLIESRRGGVETADGKRRRWDRVRGPAGALTLNAGPLVR